MYACILLSHRRWGFYSTELFLKCLVKLRQVFIWSSLSLQLRAWHITLHPSTLYAVSNPFICVENILISWNTTYSSTYSYSNHLKKKLKKTTSFFIYTVISTFIRLRHEMISLLLVSSFIDLIKIIKCTAAYDNIVCIYALIY